jgi:hypothetical protein
MVIFQTKSKIVRLTAFVTTAVLVLAIGLVVLLLEGASPSQEISPSKFLFAHRIPLSALGVTTSRDLGNMADDFANYFGAHQSTGLWTRKYSALDEDQIKLGAQDDGYLFAMASRKYFSLYPEYAPIPTFPTALAPLAAVFSPADIAAFARRVVAQSQTAQSSNQAELLLQFLLVVGRKMQESPDLRSDQWALGNYVEQEAFSGLMTLYKNKGNASRVPQLTSYENETLALNTSFSTFFSSTRNFTAYSLALINLSSVADNQTISSAFLSVGSSRENFDAMLKMFDASDPVVQDEGVVGLVALNALAAIEPEHTVARAILTNGLQVPFVCSETHELGEELVGSYLYQVNLYHWLESNDYGRLLTDDDL